MSELESINIVDLQPSQFYLSQTKIDSVKKWFDVKHLDRMAPIPVKKLKSDYVITDGHTRLYVAYAAGFESVPSILGSLV